MTAPTPIYLSHPVGRSRRERRFNLLRVRLIRDGAACLHPGYSWRCLHIRLTPDDNFFDSTLASREDGPALRRRLIWGSSSGPVPGEAATAVWAVGDADFDTREDRRVAEAAEVPVVEVSVPDQVRYMEVGRATRRPLCIPLPEPDDTAGCRMDFRTPGEVLRVFFRGLDEVCGAPALDYGRSPGHGNTHRVMERIAAAGLRVAHAAGIVDRAAAAGGWDWRVWLALRMVYAEGATSERVSLRLEERGEQVVSGRVRHWLSEAREDVRGEMRSTK